MNIECNICNKNYNSHQSLRNHINKFHKDTPQETIQESKEPNPIDYLMEMEEDTEQTIDDEITLLMLEQANISNSEAKKINCLMKFVNEIEEKFLLRVFKEAGISPYDLVNSQKDAEVTPIYTDTKESSAVLGAYIKWLNQCLAVSRAKNKENSVIKGSDLDS